MISTEFNIMTEKAEWHDLSMSQGAAIVGGSVVGGIVLGMMIHPIALVLTIPASLIVPAIVLGVRGATAPKQSIKTTIECDGKTVRAFNQRLPDTARKGRVELFSVPLDEIGACEAGRAKEMFGTDLQLGAYKAVPYQMVGNQSALDRREQIASSTTAIFLRCRYDLKLIFAENMASSLVYELVGKVNRLLDEARTAKAPPPSPAPSPSPSNPADAAPPRAAGFDL